MIGGGFGEVCLWVMFWQPKKFVSFCEIGNDNKKYNISKKNCYKI